MNMDLKKYFNSGSKTRELSSGTSTSGGDPKKIRDGSFDSSNNPDMSFLKDYLLLTVLRFYINV